MKKGLMVLLLAAGVVLLVRGVFGGRRRRTSMWEKLQAHMEEMPEDFPPRVMFDNVAAARENTERIIEILEKGGGVAGQQATESDAK